MYIDIDVLYQELIIKVAWINIKFTCKTVFLFFSPCWNFALDDECEKYNCFLHTSDVCHGKYN